jgi:hypothetical protein
MKIQFADSFSKSIKKLAMHQTWWYKTYEIFRYKIPMFIENVWYFKSELWKFRSWDYGFNLSILKRSLEKTVNTIEYYGHEVDESRLKKVQKIKRAIEILGHIKNDSYVDMAESIVGKLIFYEIKFKESEQEGLYELVDSENEIEKKHNSEVYNLARELEEEEWRELWKIFQGQNHEEYVKFMELTSDEDKRKKDLWYEWFDGSGMNHWWD